MLGADKRGQERRTDAKCRRSSAAGRHVDELGFDLEKTMNVSQSDFDGNYLPNQDKLGDDAVDKVGVLIEFYNIVN